MWQKQNSRRRRSVLLLPALGQMGYTLEVLVAQHLRAGYCCCSTPLSDILRIPLFRLQPLPLLLLVLLLWALSCLSYCTAAQNVQPAVRALGLVFIGQDTRRYKCPHRLLQVGTRHPPNRPRVPSAEEPVNTPSDPTPIASDRWMAINYR